MQQTTKMAEPEFAFSRPANRWLLTASLLCCFAAIVAPVGCGGKSDSTTQVQPPPQRPLRAMKSAVMRSQWEKAWKHADAVLERHPDDADAIAEVARVAHEMGKPLRAAELLVQSCRAESFGSAARNQQAIVAMIGVGRLHEGMQMLEEAVQQQPDQHQTRRLLYDFYMGTENRSAGVPHGQILVRQRRFDLDLLQTLSNTERRTQENESLETMASRNPNDLRPRLGAAKSEFDLGNYDASIQTLRQIIEVHPDYLPAHSLLGRALAAAERFSELEQWAATPLEGMLDDVGYWLAIGDWARAQNQPRAAARSYWEAARRDPDMMESWSKLSTSLQQIDRNELQVSGEAIARIENRATLLSTFNQQKQRFERTGGISRAIVIDIVKSLRHLGRFWEAEAWASIALTLPEDDAVPVNDVRNEIVLVLRKNPPWQMTKDQPEFQVDLSDLAPPSIGSAADLAMANNTSASADSRDRGSHLSLVDEAESRGISFFGRTSDHLDQPGIMLYETLGCGGCAIDYDLDGWSDLYLIDAGGKPPTGDSRPNSLMRNRAGHFVDVSQASASGDTGFGQGVAVGDVNEDGFPDLLVLNYGPNALLINNGDGTFQNASERLETNGNDWSTSAAIADLDADQLADIVIVNYCEGLQPVTVTCPMKDSDEMRSCTPMMFSADTDRFLQSNPQGRFVDRTKQWNAIPAVLGRGLGVVAGALDGEPGMDVLIANDMTNNHYWSRLAGQDSFELSETAMLRGLGADDRALAQGSMGIASGDMDRDGDMDFYVTNFDNEYNTFHQQRDASVWQDQTSQLNLRSSTLPVVGFGTEVIDLDNNGSSELVVSNGHVDMFSRDDKKSVYEHPLQVFRRNDGGTFDSISGQIDGDYVSVPHVGRALWTLDADRDGRTDVAITHQTEPLALLVNRSEATGNWINLRLIGRDCSRDAIGAIVEVRIDGQRWTAFQTSGDGYLCSNERSLHFGLGELSGNCQAKVTWPDGTEQLFENLGANERWLLVQSETAGFRLE